MPFGSQGFAPGPSLNANMNSPSSPRPWQSIALALLAIGVLALALGGYLTPITKFILSPIEPVQSWVFSRFQAFQDFFNAPSDLVALRQRNAALEGEVANLQAQVVDLQRQVREVEILQALLNFARAQPENKYQAAEVIGRDPSPFLQYVIVDGGSDDGLRRGMPVVSDQGLIGRIAEVNPVAARVQLITDPDSAISVRVGPNEVEAVLLGSITGELRLDLIPQDVQIQPGDLVLTSGLGGSYPADVLIGQVTSVQKEATALFQSASVQPKVDFTRLQIVLVIINFQAIDISSLIQGSDTTP